MNAGEVPPSSRRVCFGVFEADLAAGELHRQGVKVRLSAQPFSVLAVLLERPGDVVTREDLRQRLWPADTYVDFAPVSSSGVAMLYAKLGDKDAALRWLEKSVESHTRDLIFLNVEPAYDSLRDDPRFQALVRRVGLPT